MESTGQQVKKLREGQSLSQEALARLLGVSVRTVARWENGDSKPSPLAHRRLQQISPDARQGGPLGNQS
jgi:DNA-binding transcriptional regulator YiaG